MLKIITKISLTCLAVFSLMGCSDTVDDQSMNNFLPGTPQSDQFLMAIMGRNLLFSAGLGNGAVGVKIGNVSNDPAKQNVYFTTTAVPSAIPTNNKFHATLSKIANKKMKYMYALSDTEGFFEIKNKNTNLSASCKIDISQAPSVKISVVGFSLPIPLEMSS